MALNLLYTLVVIVFSALSTLGLAFAFRDRLARALVRHLQREMTEAEIATHQRTEESQKATIESLAARLGVVEAEVKELRAERTASKAEIAALEHERKLLKGTIRRLAARVRMLERIITSAGLALPKDEEESDGHGSQHAVRTT